MAAIASFGASLEVAEGVEGVVHVSELTLASTALPQDVVRVGDEVAAVATEVDRGRRRPAPLPEAALARPPPTPAGPRHRHTGPHPTRGPRPGVGCGRTP
ncbi:S1 RNA-binding domain-containing protein [Streptomyces sp. NPDC058612]|uniref:S1 RNA-binding domain-containing protein n=1 Tax=Streptomyces sp. NPDC058612 TaxID=3346555 RepID=UPI00365E69B6